MPVRVPVAVPEAEGAERTPWWRYAWGATLALSILALTYVLFDPDLGTEAPLFGELTCRGELEVLVSDGHGRPYLLAPESGVRARALGDGELRPALFTVHKREAGEEWSVYFTDDDRAGERIFFVGEIEPTTEVYVRAKDLEGRYCAGGSPIIAVEPSSPAATSSP